MKKTLIFSDVHLKVTEKDRPRQQEFIAFLRQCTPEEFNRIICVGDLFDFWFEYEHVVFSGYFEVLRVFADLRDAGIELHLVCGNHDFWAGRFLERELGFQVHKNEALLPFGAETALLVHGDGINPKDHGYHIYKRIARNPLVIKLFRLLHPDWAMNLARAVSHGSRTFTEVENTAEGPNAKALRSHAQGLLQEGAADVIICGHAHAPVLEEHPKPKGHGLYINSGDWLRHRSHVTWNGEGFHLHLGKV